MSWDIGKPVTGKLPVNSGNWQGNQTVEMLTGYWDDLLVGLKSAIDSGDFTHEDKNKNYLDYIGLGLCGFGKSWDIRYSEEIKRRLIKNFPLILKSRGSRKSIETLINCVIPGSELVHYQIPRADFSYADLAIVSDYPVTRYMICLPNSIKRDSIEWEWVTNLIKVFMPIAEVSLQYSINLPNQTLAGDWSIN